MDDIKTRELTRILWGIEPNIVKRIWSIRHALRRLTDSMDDYMEKKLICEKKLIGFRERIFQHGISSDIKPERISLEEILRNNNQQGIFSCGLAELKKRIESCRQDILLLREFLSLYAKHWAYGEWTDVECLKTMTKDEFDDLYVDKYTAICAVKNKTGELTQKHFLVQFFEVHRESCIGIYEQQQENRHVLFKCENTGELKYPNEFTHFKVIYSL